MKLKRIIANLLALTLTVVLVGTAGAQSPVSIQKLKTPGDHVIAAATEVVLFRSGIGVTQALLPLTSESYSGSILCIRGTENSSPFIVHRIVATGDDQLLVPGMGLVESLELVSYGDAVVLQVIEPGVWFALEQK